MDRFRLLILATVVLVLAIAQPASAQTAASIAVVAGNGQLTCQGCFTNSTQIPFQFFFPLIIKVLDANNNPILNKQVNWTLVSSQGPLPSFNPTTVTDGSGVTYNNVFQGTQPGTVGFPFMQSVITASADGAAFTFTVTQGLANPQSNNIQLVFAAVTSPAAGTAFSGTTGAPSTTQITAHVDAFGTPVPNVSMRLLNSNDPTQGASAACATGAGADPGSVLTDSTGNAVCNVVFGPISGNGNFTVIIGGVDPLQDPTLIAPIPGQSFAYYQSGNFPITVTPGVPGQIQVSSGNNQTINAGQSTQPLVVKVTDASGQNPIAGQTVNWTVSPAGAASLSAPSSSTNSSGLASITATLSATAVGTVTIKAALAGSLSNISTNFNVAVNVQVSGLQKIAGDSQSAPTGQAFTSPLVVQANANNGQPAQGLPISFSISGPGTLSATTATTDSTGRAQVTVTAGSTPGTVTVTASTGAFSQVFTLTVIPPGPNLSGGSVVNGADFQRNSISPCAAATIMATGLAPTLRGVAVPTGLYGPLPYTLAGDSVTVGGGQAPIYSVSNVNGNEQLTFQVPCDATPGSSVPLKVSVSGGSATINIAVLPAGPGIFGTVMSDGVTRAVLVRPDGSFVSLQNPARRGETIRLYGTGLGPVTPTVGTNSIAVPGTDSLVTGQIIVGVNNAGTRVISGRYAPSLIGVYEVTFVVPSDAPTGNDIVLSLAINVPGDSTTRFSAGSKIPIQ